MSAADQEGLALAAALERLAASGRSTVLAAEVEGEILKLHVSEGQVRDMQPRERWLVPCLAEPLVGRGTITAAEYTAAKRAAARDGSAVLEELLGRELISDEIAKSLLDRRLDARLHELLELDPAPRFTELEREPSIAVLGAGLPIEALLRERDRRAELGPEPLAEVGPPETVFRRRTQRLAEVLGYAESHEGAHQDLSATGRLVFFRVDGRRTIDELAGQDDPDRFATYRALAELLEAGLIEAVRRPPPKKKKAAPTGPRRATMGIVVVAYAVAAVLLSSGATWDTRRLPSDDPTALMGSSEVAQQVVDAHRLRRVEQALALYRVHTGRYPARLDDLVEMRYVSPDTAAVFRELHYASRGDSFTLAGPAPRPSREE